jgi:hypothetical protein
MLSSRKWHSSWEWPWLGIVFWRKIGQQIIFSASLTGFVLKPFVLKKTFEKTEKYLKVPIALRNRLDLPFVILIEWIYPRFLP